MVCPLSRTRADLGSLQVAERLEKHRRAAADSFLDEQTARIRYEGPLHISRDADGPSKPSWRDRAPRTKPDPSPAPAVGSSPQGPAPTPSGLPTSSPTPADPIPGAPPTAPGSTNPKALDGEGSVSGDEFGHAVEVRVVFDDADVDSQLDWQRSRMSNKLADEQHRVGRRVAEVVRDNLDSEVRLGAIRLVGATNLRTGFAKTVLEPYLASLASKRPPSGADDGSTTLRDVLSTAKDVRRHLVGLDIFSSIDSSLEPTPSVLASPDDLDLVFRVKEQGRYFVRTATDVGDGEGSATGTARFRNAFGGAEVIEANVGFGTRTRSSIQFRGEAPINGRPDRKLELSAFVAERDLSHFASCRERLKGGILRFKASHRSRLFCRLADSSRQANSPLGYHELALETTARRICELTPNASVGYILLLWPPPTPRSPCHSQNAQRRRTQPQILALPRFHLGQPRRPLHGDPWVVPPPDARICRAGRGRPVPQGRRRLIDVS